MFINPNEFELLRHLDGPARTGPEGGADARAAQAEPGPTPPLGVTLRKLGKRYGERVVLRGLDLELAAGEFVAVVGRSGCGKSTLLPAGGLEAPSGEQGGPPARAPVLFDGFPQWGADDRVRIMFQDARLLPWKSVLDNVALGLPRRERAQAAAVLRQVGLGDRGGDWPAQLSGGQRQRVAGAGAGAPAGPAAAGRAAGRAGRAHAHRHAAADRDAVAARRLHVRAGDARRGRGRGAGGPHPGVGRGRVALDERVPLTRPRARGSAAFAALEARVLRWSCASRKRSRGAGAGDSHPAPQAGDLALPAPATAGADFPCISQFGSKS